VVANRSSAGVAVLTNDAIWPAAPAPAITSITRSAFVINQNDSLTLTASFVGLSGTHTATVNWGDGSDPTVLSLAAGVETFSTPHPYGSIGTFPITVTVSADDGSGSDTVNLTANDNAATPPAGLVSWWTGDGTNLSAAPDIAGSNTGYLQNGASYAAGEVGQAFRFTGAAQYVDVPSRSGIPVGNSNYTLMAWIKLNNGGTEGIIGYGNYGANNQVNAFTVYDPGQAHLGLVNYWWSNDLSAPTTLPASGAWYLVAATFDGTMRKIYVDGQVVASDRPTGHNVPNAGNLRIGSTNFGQYCNGLIDEPQVFNRALAPEEIQAVYDAGSAGQIEGVTVEPPPPARVPAGQGGSDVVALAAAVGEIGLPSALGPRALPAGPADGTSLHGVLGSPPASAAFLPSAATSSGPLGSRAVATQAVASRDVLFGSWGGGWFGDALGEEATGLWLA
jgi:hypothetical protein